MKIDAIDIGSNSIHMVLVVDIGGGTLELALGSARLLAARA